MCDQILEQFALFKKDNITSIDKCIDLAKQALASQELQKEVDKYIFVEQKQKETRPFNDLISVATEWFKTNIPELKLVLLRHLPALLHAYLLKNQKGRVEEGSLLCIFNCEVKRRTDLQSSERTERFVTNNIKTLYEPEANTKTSSLLTISALKNKNEDKQPKEYVKHDYESGLPFLNEIKYGNMNRILRIILQVYFDYIHDVGEESRKQMCKVIKEITSTGLPFTTPSFDQIYEKAHAKEEEIPEEKTKEEEEPNEDMIIIESDTLKERQQREKEQLQPKPKTPEEPPKEEPKEEPPKRKEVQAKQTKNQLTAIQHYMTTMQLSPPKSGKIVLGVSVLREFVNILRFCIFNPPKEKEELHSIYEALYAVHLRSVFAQSEELVLYTNSILKVLPL